MSDLTPYRRLLDVCRAQAERLAVGDVDGLLGLEADRELALAAIPDVAPAAARPLLEELTCLIAANASALDASSARVAGQLAQATAPIRRARAYDDGGDDLRVERHA